MLKIESFPEQVGGRISENGNPQILAIDSKSGIVVAIEVQSANWKKVLEQLGKLHGVGIVPASIEDLAEIRKQNGQ